MGDINEVNSRKTRTLKRNRTVIGRHHELKKGASKVENVVSMYPNHGKTTRTFAERVSGFPG